MQTAETEFVIVHLTDVSLKQTLDKIAKTKWGCPLKRQYIDQSSKKLRKLVVSNTVVTVFVFAA